MVFALFPPLPAGRSTSTIFAGWRQLFLPVVPAKVDDERGDFAIIEYRGRESHLMLQSISFWKNKFFCSTAIPPSGCSCNAWVGNPCVPSCCRPFTTASLSKAADPQQYPQGAKCACRVALSKTVKNQTRPSLKAMKG
jgi:hypothetical protein